METWEREHVLRNLPELLQNTICSTQLFAALQSKNILSQDDREKIEAEKTNSEKNNKLYDIVQTRTNGYSALIKALGATNQTGATNILRQGFPLKQVQNKWAIFLGKKLKLFEILKDQVSNLTTGLLATLTTDDYLKFLESLKEKEPMHLVPITIPPKSQFYIPRVLIKHIEIQATVFKIDAPDVFVFKTDSPKKLRSYANEPIRKSSEQLRNKTAKFILLEIEEDWIKLKKIVNNIPIHLVKYNSDDNTFLLLETSGGSTILHNFLTSDNEFHEIRIAEEDVFEKLEADGMKGLCICDSPGSGKSLLLESLTRMATEKFPDQLSCLIYLPAIASIITQNSDKKSSVSCLQTLAIFLTETPFANAVLEQVLKLQKIGLNLFLDSLDEVPRPQLEAVTTFIEKLSTGFANTKIFLSARTHQRVQLEKTLGVLAFDIEPFSDETQVKFITNFWNETFPNLSMKKLEQFATQALATINEQLTDKDRKIAGVPLHCKLIADVLASDAELYSHPKRNLKIDKNLFKNVLYPNYIYSKLGQSDCNLRCIFKNNVDQTRLCPVSCQVLNFHLIAALSDICPSFLSKIWKRLNVPNLDENIVLSKSVLIKAKETQTQKLKFVHRTFAEYLVAYFVENTFTNEFWNRKVPKALRSYFYGKVFMDNDIFGDFCGHGNSVVVYFLNYLVTQAHTHEQIQVYDNTCALPNDPQHFFQLLLSFIKHKYFGLVELIMVLASMFDNWTKSKIGVFLYEARHNLVALLASHFDLLTATILFKYMNDVFYIDLDKACILEKNSPIEAAIENHDVDAVEFFLQKPHQTSGLLSGCAENTHSMSPMELKRRNEILEIVTEKHTTLSTLPENSPAAMENVHLETIKQLVNLDAQLIVENRSVVHAALKYMDKMDFLALNQFLITDCKAVYLYAADFDKPTIPLVDIALTRSFGIEVSIEILRMLAKASVNGVLPNGSSICKEASILCDINMMKPIYSAETSSVNIWNFKLYSEIFRTCQTDLLNGAGNFLKDLLFPTVERDATEKKNDILHHTEQRLCKTINVFDRDVYGNSILHHLARMAIKDDFIRGVAVLVKNWNNLVQMAYPCSVSITPAKLKRRFCHFFVCQNMYRNIALHYAVQYVNLETEDFDYFLMGGSMCEMKCLEWERDPQHVIKIINYSNMHGETPLHFAIRGEKPLPFLEHMISRGSNIKVKKANGDNLAHFCASEFTSLSPSKTMHLVCMIENLFALSVDANDCNDDGNNVLQYVLLNAVQKQVRYFLENRLVDFAKVCINYGIKLDNVNKEKYTAYDIAVKQNYSSEIVNILNFPGCSKDLT